VARVPRSAFPEYGIFHVTARGAEQISIYREDDDRRWFLAILRAAMARFGWSRHAFCLMTNHYHLVIETHQAALSDGMHSLNGIYAQSFNAKYKRWGHLFGERFWCRAVDEENLADTCLYVVANPVRAGICEDISEWPWGGCLYDLEP
jgi:putative transposase